MPTKHTHLRWYIWCSSIFLSMSCLLRLLNNRLRKSSISRSPSVFSGLYRFRLQTSYKQQRPWLPDFFFIACVQCVTFTNLRYRISRKNPTNRLWWDDESLDDKLWYLSLYGSGPVAWRRPLDCVLWCCRAAACWSGRSRWRSLWRCSPRECFFSRPLELDDFLCLSYRLIICGGFISNESVSSSLLYIVWRTKINSYFATMCEFDFSNFKHHSANEERGEREKKNVEKKLVMTTKS